MGLIKRIKKNKRINYLGGILEESPKIHLMNHDYGFNFNHNTLMQKLISTEVIETSFWIHPDDYFKSLISLDYYTKILFNNNKPIKNLEYIFEETGKKELTISVVKKELRESIIDELREKSIDKRISGIIERYEKNNIIYEAKDEPCVYYKIIGRMIYDLFDNKKYLDKIKNLNDLRALIFINVMNDYSKKIKKSLEKQDFLKASIKLVKELKPEEKELDDYINRITECFEEEPTQTLATLINKTKLSPENIEEGINYLIKKKVVGKSNSFLNGEAYHLKYKSDKE